jgi:hypothetical protein
MTWLPTVALSTSGSSVVVCATTAPTRIRIAATVAVFGTG